MAELDDLARLLDDYHLYHAGRAELLRERGHPGQARAADRRALELAANPAERAVLQQRLTWAQHPGGESGSVAKEAGLEQKDARQHNRAICTPPPCGAIVFLAAAWASFATKDITTGPCGCSPGF